MEEQREKTVSGTMSLLLEILFVTAASILLIRFLNGKFGSNEACLALTAPVVLISGAIIPTLLRKKELNQIGFQIRNFKALIITLLGTCLVIFSALICGILILNYFNIPLPMRPVIPQKDWPIWLTYQFMFVAIPEEVFFRGYLQSNVTQLLRPITDNKSKKLTEFVIIIISAAVFAAFHVMLQGKIISIITFFPGLIMGWLFYRTNSVLTPVLFHAFANIGYGLISGLLS